MMRSALSPVLTLVGALALIGCGEHASYESDDNRASGTTSSNNNSVPQNNNSSGYADAGVAPPPPASDAGAGSSADAAAPSASDAGVAGDGGIADATVAPLFNPYVEAEHDPFSTFAADVDSASFDIFAKSITEGAGLPAPSTVRSEEFVNFFEYDYPQPDPVAPDPFEISLNMGMSPTGETHLLRVGIQGRDMLADRPAANLVFLVDISGSMSARDKLPLAKQLLVAALDVLEPDDKISVVTYSERVAVAVPVTEVRQRASIEPVIQALQARGGTAGADGLQLAYDQAAAGFVQGGVNHIILCTDGDFNIGPYTNPEMLQLVEDRRRTGVTFTALGFGRGNLNDSMMEAISNAGNGIYRVITGVKTAERYVARRLLSDVVHIAKDVKLQVEFNPGHVYAYRQVGYENRQLADAQFRDDAVDAGEIGSGHQMTALYEVVLLGGQVPAPLGAPAMLTGAPVQGDREVLPDELVRVKLRYKQPGATQTDPATEMSTALRADEVADLDGESEYAWAVATLAGRIATNPFVPASHITLAEPLLLNPTNPDRRGMTQLFIDAQPLLP